MANRMQRLVQLGKQGLVPPPFSIPNPNLSGDTSSLNKADNNIVIEPIASTTNDSESVLILPPLNRNPSDKINIQEINTICEGSAKEEGQSVVSKKRKRSKSSSSSDSSSSSSSSSSSNSSISSSSSSSSNTQILPKQDSLLDDIHVEPLRHANHFDYETLGMHENLIPIPDTDIAGEQTTDEKAKKSGPIYVPDQYVHLIRDAKKKGNPFTVHEMHFSNFYDLKALADEQALNFRKDNNADTIKVTELTMIKFTKNSDFYEFKTSFEGQWIQASLKLARGRKKITQPIEINLKAAYNSKMNISDAKKSDLIQLLRSDIVPSYYEGFYNSL